MTLAEYDERALGQMRNQLLSRVLIIAAIHYYWGAAVPLVVQVVSTPLSLWKENLVRVYVRGETLKRPFPVPASPFAALLGGGGAAEEPESKKEKKKRRDDSKDD